MIVTRQYATVRLEKTGPSHSEGEVQGSFTTPQLGILHIGELHQDAPKAKFQVIRVVSNVRKGDRIVFQNTRAVA